MAVEVHKHYKNRQPYALVPVHKRMISQKGPRQRSGKRTNPDLSGVVLELLRPRNGGLQRILVANPLKSTVGLNQPPVNVAQYIATQIRDSHFANSR